MRHCHATPLRPLLIGLALVGLLGTGGAVAEKPAETLQGSIEAIIHGLDYKQAHWGLLFVELDSGKVLYERNADQLFAPASVTKLYSVAAALDALGADYRFQTPVYRRGELDREGQLSGDLSLVASGDLSLGGRTEKDQSIAFKNADHTYANGNETAELTEPDPLAGLNELARQVAAAGIRRVRGEVWIDDRLFDKAEGSGSGPSRLTPILVNDNVIDLVITPRAAGAAASVQWRPETAAYQIDAQVETTARGSATRIHITTPAPGRVVVRGRIGEGHKPLVRIHEVEDSAGFARALFIEALRRAGVKVDASPLATNRTDLLPAPDACGKLPRVALLTSPPFSESVRLILKVSHNLHASTLPLLLAARNGKRTLAEGLHLQHDFLARAGVDVDTISFGGGAGGARADATTPRATVQLLRFMAKHKDFAAYQAAMPVLGVDGTLAGVVPADSPARGKVQAKTGTLTWKNVMNDRTLLGSKALAGYLTTAGGRELAFAMFVNNVPLPKSGDPSREGRVLGRLCEVVYGAK